MARLGFRITIDGLDDETLVVREYRGYESISDSVDPSGVPFFGYRYFIELASRRDDLAADAIIDRSALFEVIRDGVVEQRVHGIIKKFSSGDTGYSHSFYSLELVPSFERLSLRHNSRIFQHQTVAEIIAVLLEEMGIHDSAFSLKRPLKAREFCVQYRETDLQFIHRIAAEEGLMYGFVHHQDKHVLFFTDNNQSWQQLDTPIEFNATSGGAASRPYISALEHHTQTDPTSTALQDYSFKQPGYHFAQLDNAVEADYQLNVYEHYDMPGRFKDDETGLAFNQIRLQYLRREAIKSTGKSNQASLQAGVLFSLSDHLDPNMNQDWLPVWVEHTGRQDQALEEAGSEGETTYSNRFTLVPADVLYQAKPRIKPVIDGPNIAMVVGPEGEEIYCDEYGRVKLHFYWDRYSNGDEQSSCWVRVSQGWAGAQYGMMAIPRIGHEVIVTFLNGDPDQPIVTGRTYHATNTTPYTLPEHKTKTVIRTETHQGEGFNELSFEDQSGQEKLAIHAQKDMNIMVNNDHVTDIQHDQHLTVENDRYTHILANDHLTVDGEQCVKVGATRSLNVAGSLQQKVSQKTILDSCSEVHLKAGNKIVLDAGNEITLKASGSFVKVDAAGVHVVGPAIGLNSGGSAGSGSGYAGQEAVLPNVLQEIAIPAEIIQPQITPSMSQQVQANVIEGIPITQTCQKRADGTCPLTDCPCGNNVA